MSAKKINTRFRAYQLGSKGSSYSYYYDNYFTLIEARYNDVNCESLKSELKICGKSSIDCLHITSWDTDHCAKNDLESILTEFEPKKIEFPGYVPESDTAKECLKIIKNYQSQKKENRKVQIQQITPTYISSLDSAEEYGYKDMLYWPKKINQDCHNDNSTVKFFRCGSFNVLSTGDVECKNIGKAFLGGILKRELDILILPHHGSANGFVDKSFLEKTQPHFTICTSNYDNEHDHPAEEIKELLHKLKIPIFTTKTGDIIVRSLGTHDGEFEILNLKAGSTEVSSSNKFTAKKKKLLSMNKDTVRAIKQGKPFKGPPKH